MSLQLVQVNLNINSQLPKFSFWEMWSIRKYRQEILAKFKDRQLVFVFLGTNAVGKSTIASELSHQLKISASNVIDTDNLRESIRSFKDVYSQLPAEEHLLGSTIEDWANLKIWTELEDSSYLTDHELDMNLVDAEKTSSSSASEVVPVDESRKFAEKRANILSITIKQVLTRKLNQGTHAIFEGVDIRTTPFSDNEFKDFIQSRKSTTMIFINLTLDDKMLKERLHKKYEWNPKLLERYNKSCEFSKITNTRTDINSKFEQSKASAIYRNDMIFLQIDNDGSMKDTLKKIKDMLLGQAPM